MNLHDPLGACPVCATPRPADHASTEPWCCSINCYRAFHDIPATPSCHDAVTTTCPICQRLFTPAGRQRFCSDACRAAAYRRRRDAARPTITVPRAQPRRPITVYECDSCGTRAVGQQHCPDCATFTRKIGIGGECPHCSEPVAIVELIGEEVAT